MEDAHLTPDDVYLRYFLTQNDAIDAGTVSGVKINVKNVGMGGPYMVISMDNGRWKGGLCLPTGSPPSAP